MVYQWFCIWGFMAGAFFLFRTDKQFHLTATLLLLTCVISSLYAILEYLLIVPASGWPLRMSGFFNNKNVFGLFIIWGIVLSCYFLFTQPKKKWKLFSAAALVLLLSVLILSDSRGGLILSFTALTATIIPFSWKYIKISKLIRYGIYLGVFCSALIPVLFWSDSSWVRVARLIVNPDMDVSAQLRLNLYSSSFSLFLKDPLFGSGIGNYILSIKPFQTAEFVLERISNFKFALNAESDYFEVLTESGIVGLILYLTFMLGAVVIAIGKLKRSWNKRDHTMLVLLIIMLLSAAYDTALRHLPTGFLFWAAAGYFWREKLKPAQNLSPKGKAYIKTGILVVHIILAGFFIRILAGDYFYIKYLKSNRENIPHIAKSLEICPFHPDALYSAACIEAGHGGSLGIRNIADKLDATSPHYRPTNNLRAISYYNENKYDTAFTLIQKDLRRYPAHFPLQKLKVLTLAKMGECEELTRYRDSLIIGLEKPKLDFQKEYYISKFRQGAGKIRTAINEKKTKLDFIQKMIKRYNKRMETYEEKLKLEEINCEEDTTKKGVPSSGPPFSENQ
ncbi:MAG: O-antigen ligase family protein [Chitinispirillaceae bacterium]